MTQELNELQAWMDRKPKGRGFCIIGKGKALHLSNMNDETLCGRLMMPGSRYVGNHDTDYAPCGSCWKVMVRVVSAETFEQGEIDMAAKNDTKTTQDDNDKVVEQVNANIERARSLAEAENVDGLATLAKETEELISGLPTRGKAGDSQTWAQAKQELRAGFRAASTVQEKETPAPATEVVVLETRDYTAAEGVSELVTLGAEKFTEGVRTHLRASDLAKDIARVLLDMRVRMANKEGAPDIKAASHGSKEASKAMFSSAGEMFRTANPEASDYDAQLAIKKLVKSVQNHMPTVRAEYLRELDNDEAEAARFAALPVPEGKEDAPVSEIVAAYYDVELVSRYELDKARAESGQSAPAPEEIAPAEDGEKAETEEQTATQVVTLFFLNAEQNIGEAERALLAADDKEAKEAAIARIDSLIAHLATLKAGL